MNRGQYNNYPESFRRQVLEDYFSSNGTIKACATRWGIPWTSLNNWLKTCKNAQKSVSLRQNAIHMDPKDQAIADLRLENERLRREAEYHKLRAAGYERLLEIVKQEDGIDLLKKDGAKQ